MRKLIVIASVFALSMLPAVAAAAPPAAYSSESESAHAYLEQETESGFLFAALEAGSWEFTDQEYSDAWSGVSFYLDSYSETGYLSCYASDETDVTLDRQLTGLTVATTLAGECYVSVEGEGEGAEPPLEEIVTAGEASIQHDEGEGPGAEFVPVTVTVTATWTGVGTLSRNSWNSRGDGYVCRGSSTSRDAAFTATVEIVAEGLELPSIDFDEAYAGLDRWFDTCQAKGSPGPA